MQERVFFGEVLDYILAVVFDYIHPISSVSWPFHPYLYFILEIPACSNTMAQRERKTPAKKRRLECIESIPTVKSA
jgi:hypothetical protein